MPKLSVIIPVYNEEKTVREIVGRVQATPYEKEIILVNDASSDGTADVLTSLESQYDNLKVLHHVNNQGKGAALRTGFQQITGEIALVQDADLEYDPADYGVLLGPLLDGRADVVFGSRFIGGVHRVLFYWHYLGNQVLTTLCNMVSNLNLSDMETCYKAFRADVVKNISLKSNRFGFEPEFTIKVSKKKYRVYEVPISYNGRDYSEGKKITWRDGVAAIFAIFYFWIFD